MDGFVSYDRFVSLNGGVYKTREEKEKADREHEKICLAEVTMENIYEKSCIVEGAAEEMSCDEYEGDEKMACDLARQLYAYFDNDTDKMQEFYAQYRKYETYGFVDAITWLKNLCKD